MKRRNFVDPKPEYWGEGLPYTFASQKSRLPHPEKGEISFTCVFSFSQVPKKNVPPTYKKEKKKEKYNEVSLSRN